MKKEYKKLESIGKGAFATAWLAQDEQGRKVVIKEYASEALSEARREYLFLKVLNTDRIVKAIEFQENPPYLVQEYVPGEVFQPQNLKTTQQKYRFLAELAAAFSQMHSANIAYNDLKPANILMQKGKPVLIDLGLATPNLFQDNIFRGTPAYAAPEKLLHKQNSLAADVFAFGLLSLQTLSGQLPADDLPFEEYKKLLSAEAEWEKYLLPLLHDEMLLATLSPAPNQRPSMAQLATYFARLSGEENSDIQPDIIKQYVFLSQKKAVGKLTSRQKLVCSESDEPEKIVEQAILWLESAGKEAKLLNEADFIWHPQEFYHQFPDNIKDESGLIDFFKTKKISPIIFRNNQNTKFFDRLTELENSLIIEVKNKSSLGNINFAELQEISQKFNLKITGLASDFSAKPQLTRLQLLQINSPAPKSSVPTDLLHFLSAVNLPIPLNVIEYIYPDSINQISNLLNQPGISIKSDGLYFADNKFASQVKRDVLEKTLQAAEQFGYLALAAKITLLLHDEIKAEKLIENYIAQLIGKEYYTSAYEVLQSFADAMRLPVSLQKRRAFLLRKNGFLAEALQAYEAIYLPKNSLEYATIASDRAVILQDLNRPEEALKIYETALPIFAKENIKKSYLRTLNNIGVIYVQLSRFQEAEMNFLKMLNVSVETDDKQFNTMSHLNLADVYLRRGEWKKSLYQAQTAAEMSRKFKRKNIEIWAQIYGIQAQWALGLVENLDEIILQISTDDEWQEQSQLKEQFALNLLPIMLNLNTEKAEKLFSILNAAQIPANEKCRFVFWYFVEKQDYWKAAEILRKIEDKIYYRIGQAFLAANSQLMVSALRDLALQNDVFSYLQTAVLALNHPILAADKELKIEVENFAALHPFHPLMTLKNKKADLSGNEHLQLLWEIISLIHSNQSFDATMQSILGGIIRIAALERAVYYTFDNGEMKPHWGLNRDLHPLDPEKIRVSQTILSETIKLGHIRFFESLQEDTPFDIHSSIFGLGLRTAVCYPIIVNNEIRGVIYADATDAKEFTEEDRNLLETLFVQSRAALEKNEKIDLLTRERDRIRQSAESAFPEIIGNSKPMRKIFSLLQTIGSHNVNVLITGPTGSGKELIAKALHRQYNSPAPFIAVNCAAIPENLLESELFGYTRGAFTGAIRDTKGKIEAANNGTLFLDEIGDMPAALQSKLLRVLQDRIITPLGSNREIPVSFRLVTATNRDLKDLVKQGLFREDLYFRLNVVEINLPALAERKDDIIPLAEFFLQKFNDKFGKQVKQIGARSARTLLQKEWHGNVRELENTMEKAVLLSPGEELESKTLDIDTDEMDLVSHEQLPLEWEKYREFRKRILQELDKRYTDQLLEKTTHNINKASTLGGIPRPQIYRIIKNLKQK
ncbi:MAG TPA: sigma 54-interacting transcriptional regulator [Candidatus Cloacimonadota bacterium]|nr:sigma 54-interacting transcriptional regulator [Candidatus Cloacimonadota bacterium]